MRVSQLDNYINRNPLYNTPHFVAWGLAQRLRRFGWHNLKYRFPIPQIESIMVYPLDPEIEPEEAFTSEMFGPGGFLHEKQLNHYLICKDPILLINVGYLWHHFAISDDFGYAEYARMRRIAKDAKKKASSTTTDPAEGRDS